MATPESQGRRMRSFSWDDTGGLFSSISSPSSIPSTPITPSLDSHNSITPLETSASASSNRSTSPVTDFNAKRQLLKKKKIDIDEKQNIEYIEGEGSDLIKSVENYDENDSSGFWKLFFTNMFYGIEKQVVIMTDNFVFQLNSIYSSNYSYYELFLNIFFVMLIFVIGVILYWDHVYRTSSRESRCGNLKLIIEENSKAYNPFVYTIMIIHKNYIDQYMDKYIMKIEYNFMKKTTNIYYGEEKFIKEVEITEYTSSKKFTYYDITNMSHSYVDNIDASIITNMDYKFMAVDHESRPLKYDLRPSDTELTVTVHTEAAENLAKFVRDYGRNKNTELYPIYDILNAVEQHNMKLN